MNASIERVIRAREAVAVAEREYGAAVMAALKPGMCVTYNHGTSVRVARILADPNNASLAYFSGTRTPADMLVRVDNTGVSRYWLGVARIRELYR